MEVIHDKNKTQNFSGLKAALPAQIGSGLKVTWGQLAGQGSLWPRPRPRRRTCRAAPL